ncbi:hypothetical protein SBA4_4030016 [Candidatus Sulfopaludibacter sp. SbA4]|nr:hypothetical protein SBA4_4030016 [Candidatus Sulfopaludibacter sp. SbA4]
MVRTRRRPRAPLQLVRKKAAWTERWEQILAGSSSGDWAPQSAKAALRKPLLALTHGKCAFCETRLGKDVYPQIEHYVSRKVAPRRAFEWRNLLPVCQMCNVSKGHSDHARDLLKPDDEDPEPYFRIGPEGEITPHPRLDESGKRRADKTIRLCDLTRGGLQVSRSEVAQQVRWWLDRSAGLANGLNQEIEEWKHLSDPRMEYKLVVRHVLTQNHHPELADLDRQRFQRGK